MLKYIIKKLAYGILVLLGVVVLVFVLFQGFGDPARLVMGLFLSTRSMMSSVFARVSEGVTR